MQTAYDLSTGALPRFAMTQFTTDEFFRFWPQLEEMLDKVPHTWRYWTKDHICRTITNGHMQAWGIGPPPTATLIIFTTVSMYPSMKVLTAMWAAGTFEDEMIPLIDVTLSGFARLNDCEELEVRGRVGWEQKMKMTGFKRESVVWTRRVENLTLN